MCDRQNPFGLSHTPGGFLYTTSAAMHSALSEGVHGKFYGVSAIAAELPQDRTACVPLLSGVKRNKAVKSFTCDILPVQFRDVLFRKTSAASYPSPFHGIDGEDFLIAAVTLKQPVWFVPFIHVIESDGNELTEPLSGDVIISGFCLLIDGRSLIDVQPTFSCMYSNRSSVCSASMHTSLRRNCA